MQWTAFKLPANGTLCALGIAEIQEILKVEKINESILASEICIGTIDLCGSMVPIVNFFNLLGYGAQGSKQGTDGCDKRIIVLKIGAELFGLMVDAVDSIISYFQDELIAFPVLNPERSDLFLGCISQEGRDEILLLNHDRILLTPKLKPSRKATASFSKWIARSMNAARMGEAAERVSSLLPSAVYLQLVLTK